MNLHTFVLYVVLGAISGYTAAAQNVRGGRSADFTEARSSGNSVGLEPGSERSLQSDFADFCWKKTYGRGVGTVLNSCPSGKTKIGALCYDHCPNGYARFGVDCHQVCPSGWRSDGLFCAAPDGVYGRGTGWPWKFGDALNNNGMIQRCEKKHGKGNCEMCWAMAYPKCKKGYHGSGCNLCEVSCSSAGLNSPPVFGSCAKKIILGKPTPLKCPSHKQYDAALCYNKCSSGYTGIGK